VGKSTVELYCDLDGLQAPGGGSIPADVMVQAQRPDLVIIDQSAHGRHRIALVELTCHWNTVAKRAEERKTARYADLKVALSNEEWDCSLYLIEVGMRGHIIKSVKDRLWSLLQAWVPAGHWSGIGQMMKDVSRISLACLFAIFQSCNDPVWFSPCIVM
jgi:transposase